MKEISKQVYDAMDTLNEFCWKQVECDRCPLYNKHYEDCDLSLRNPNAYHRILDIQNDKYYTCVDEEYERTIGIEK